MNDGHTTDIWQQHANAHHVIKCIQKAADDIT